MQPIHKKEWNFLLFVRLYIHVIWFFFCKVWANSLPGIYWSKVITTKITVLQILSAVVCEAD